MSFKGSSVGAGRPNAISRLVGVWATFRCHVSRHATLKHLLSCCLEASTANVALSDPLGSWQVIDFGMLFDARSWAKPGAVACAGALRARLVQKRSYWQAKKGGRIAA